MKNSPCCELLDEVEGRACTAEPFGTTVLKHLSVWGYSGNGFFVQKALAGLLELKRALGSPQSGPLAAFLRDVCRAGVLLSVQPCPGAEQPE